MRKVELFDRVKGFGGVARRHVDALDHLQHAAAIAVDDDGGDTARCGGDAVRFQIPDRLRLDLSDTRAR